MEIGSIRQLIRFRGWIWLILITAVCLRLYHLTEAPPGLTHDEADHGISAWQVVNGEQPIYFTIAHGREPLYDYVTAVLMAGLGPTYLAGRLTAVFASLLLIVIMYAWVHRTFNKSTALLTAAGLALSFWPQMTGRQMLRSTMLPTLFALAVYFFLAGRGTEQGSRGAEEQGRTYLLSNYQLPLLWPFSRPYFLCLFASQSIMASFSSPVRLLATIQSAVISASLARNTF